MLRRAAALDVEDGLLGMVRRRQIGGVPQSPLAHRGVEADLEHVAHAVRAIRAATVPQPVVREEQRAGRAYHMLLAEDVLIAPDRCLADDAQMRSRNVARAAHRRRHFVREVHQLDVERPARVDRGILMRVLRDALLAAPIARRIGDVQEVVVEQRAGADQTLDGAAHPRQPHQPAERGLRRIRLEQRRAGRHLGDAIGAHRRSVAFEQGFGVFARRCVL